MIGTNIFYTIVLTRIFMLMLIFRNLQAIVGGIVCIYVCADFIASNYFFYRFEEIILAWFYPLFSP